MTTSTSPNFSIVIPNYNGEKFIKACLLALKNAISACPLSSFQVILVDNHSFDNSFDIFKKIFPKGEVLHLSRNFGFAKAVNIGISVCKYDYVCVLNNDLNLDQKWFYLISKVIKQNHKASTYCGTVLNYDGTKIESQGFRYFMVGRCENINNNQPFSVSKLNQQKTFVPIWGSSAAVVVYKKTTLNKVGLFDESFFAYIEDVDLCYRLHLHGETTLLIPRALSRHLGGGTSNRMGTLRQYYTLRNWVKLILKNYTLLQVIRYFPGILLERLRNVSYLLRSSHIMNKQL